MKETEMEDRNIHRDRRQRQRDERDCEQEREIAKRERETEEHGCEKEGTVGWKVRLSGASHCHVLRRPPTSSSRMTRARPKSPITAVPSSVSCAAVRTTQERGNERERGIYIERYIDIESERQRARAREVRTKMFGERRSRWMTGGEMCWR